MKTCWGATAFKTTIFVKTEFLELLLTISDAMTWFINYKKKFSKNSQKILIKAFLLRNAYIFVRYSLYCIVL